MTIRNKYPKVRPDIIYNVINGREELPINAEYSRARTATYVDATGSIQTAAANVPRFDHDPTTLEFKGLLLGKATENLVQWSSDPQKYSTSNSATWNPISATFRKSDPMGGNKACEIEVDYDDFSYWRDIRSAGNVINGKIYWVSYFVKQVSGGSDTVSFQIDENNFSGRRSYYRYTFSTNKLEETESNASLDLNVDNYRNGWVRLAVKLKASPNSSSGSARWVLMNRTIRETDPVEKYQFYGWQIEQNLDLSNYIPVPTNDTGAYATADDQLALTSTKNFDLGFSLLLDSETTTQDKLYSIQQQDTTEIAYLQNDNGTLKWDINGVSAQNPGPGLPPNYPQVGFQIGRVRTISSFGQAGELGKNFLYTTGLSFNTEATPGSSAQRIAFGVPQTLKALYIWPGQLEPDQAVSLIKGDPKVIKDQDILTDAYSFVYDTDPENIGTKNITLNSVKAKVGSTITIDWGDDTVTPNVGPEITPTHEYPYPGEYRIQITVPFGQLDVATLGNNPQDSITRVDRWAPQHRVGAAGFSGDELVGILSKQQRCNQAPPFEYANLTNINNAFQTCEGLQVNNWDWVPYKLESCINLAFAFRSICRNATDSTDALKASFPQLQTSSVLQNVNTAFANSIIRGWKDANGNPTSQPFTNSENVTNWNDTFANMNLVDLVVNTISARTLSGTFQGNSWTISPYFNAPNCTNFSRVFQRCESMTEMNPTIPSNTYSKGIDFNNAWNGCSSLASFPLINVSRSTNFESAWEGCSSLETFPAEMFDITRPLRIDAFNQAFSNCALTPESIENILVSLAANAAEVGNTNIQLGIDRGTNAPRYAGSSGTASDDTSWTATAEAKFQELLAAGWTITYNKYAGETDTLPPEV